MYVTICTECLEEIGEVGGGGGGGGDTTFKHKIYASMMLKSFLIVGTNFGVFF